VRQEAEIVCKHTSQSRSENPRAQIFDAAKGTPTAVLKHLEWRSGQDANQTTLEADSSGFVDEIGVPYGVAYSKNGHLYVTDTYYHRVLVFGADLEPLQKYGSGKGCVKP
jgi:DNA-binding beta-propeller fold protein YncE